MRTNGAGPVELDEFASIGRDLGSALKLAERGNRKGLSPIGLGVRGGGIRWMGHIVSKREALRPTVEAVTLRFAGGEAQACLMRAKRESNTRECEGKAGADHRTVATGPPT
jgi:hypothetical protein